jgi:hypothetical protein
MKTTGCAVYTEATMLDLIKEFWVQIYAAISLALLIANWFLAKTYAKTTTVGQLESRVTRIENTLEHMPTKEELNRLDKTISGLTESMSATKDGIVRLERKTDILLENELRGDR